MKNSLIKNKLEGCPVSIFDNRYKDIRKDEFKDKQGIYALYDKNNRLYYVGHASDLRGRLNHHVKTKAGKWEYFSVYFTETKEDAKALEAVILSIDCPKGNAQNPLKRDTEMKKRIERRMEETDKEKRKFRKSGKSRDGGGKKSKDSSKASHRTRESKAGRSLEGLVSRKTPLKKEYKNGKTVQAFLLPSGKVEYAGKGDLSPSRAASLASGNLQNGWTFWTIQSGGKWITLKKFALND